MDRSSNSVKQRNRRGKARLSARASSAQEADVPAMLRERHRKDAEDVAAGRRSARSLFMFQKGDLDGIQLTQNPESEFERDGEGW